MNQSDVSSLPGLVLHVLIISVATTYPLSLVLLWRYRRTVEALAQQKTGTSAVGEEPRSAVPTAFEGTADELYTELRHAPRRSATLQGLAGAVVACCLAALFLASGGVPPTFPRMAFVSATLFWPGVLAIVLTMGMSRGQRLLIFLTAGLGYCLFGVAASVATPGEAVLEAAFFWVALNVPATLVLAPLLMRHVRAVGSSVFLVTIASVSGAAAVLEFLQRAPGAALLVERRLTVDLGLEPWVGVALLLLCGFLVAGVCGVWLFRRLGLAYAHNRVGDEGITLSALWLVYTGAFATLMLSFGGTVLVILGLASFPLYLALTWSGRRLFLSVPSGPGPMLLLLRVFSSKGPTPQLFHTVSRHWRHVGPIAIIGWKDLASAAIEPNEFMAFLRRQAKDLFVTNPAASLAALDAGSTQRDPDGRFRCQQRLCFDNTWKPTVEGLIQRSAVVLVDLRALGDKVAQTEKAKATGEGGTDGTKEQSGIATELGALKRLDALGRAVLLHDGSGIVHTTLETHRIDPASVALLEVKGNEPKDVSNLLRHLAHRCLSNSSQPRVMEYR